MTEAIACIVPCIIKPPVVVDHAHYVAEHPHWWQVVLLVLAVMVFVGCIGWLMDRAGL